MKRAPQGLEIVSDGTNYFAQGLGGGTSNLFAPNSQTANYTVTAADMLACRTLVAPSGAFTFTLPATAPAAGACAWFISYSTSAVFIAPGTGRTINGVSATNSTFAATSASSPMLMFVVSDGTNYVLGQPGGQGGTASNNSVLVGNGQYYKDSTFYVPSSALMQSNLNTQGLTYASAVDGNFNVTGGIATFRGCDQTGAGGAATVGCGAVIRGGNVSATNAAAQAGTSEIEPGQAMGATQGLQGLLFVRHSYVKGAFVTQYNGECLSAGMTVTDCAASPAYVEGVADTVNSNTVLLNKAPSESPINASAAVTLGHTLCWGTTAGQVTDSGGTLPCTSAQGPTAGTVLLTSGVYKKSDATTVTLSTTLPLVAMTPAVNSPAKTTTATNCSSNASPAVCSSAAAGAVAIPTGVTSVTLQVNTTAVTANSEIFLASDDSLTIPSTTCNSTLATLVGGLAVTARSAGSSFTITYNGTIATNPLCVSYLVVN